MEALVEILKKSEGVWVSCSDLGAIVGFHPYADTSEIFIKYLYQDLELLQQFDCQQLGIHLVSAQDEASAILEKLGAKTKMIVDAAIEKAAVRENLHSQQQARALLSSIQTALSDPDVVSLVGKEEHSFILREYAGQVRKLYGTHCEQRALDQYSLLTGYDVIERNSKMYTYDILVPDRVPETSTSSSQETTSSERNSQHSADHQNSLVSGDGSKQAPSDSDNQPRNAFDVLRAAQAQVNSRTSKRRLECSDMGTDHPSVKPRAAFMLVGKVDGISYQPDPEDTRATPPTDLKVVVELKTRVRRIAHPPPLYEQIQLISYLVMLGCEQGDLVQCIPKVLDEGIDGAACPAEDEGWMNEFSIHRVKLHGPPYYHSHHWETTILPRLNIFRDALLAVRKDNELRHTFLLASAEERQGMLHALCPYFS